MCSVFIGREFEAVLKVIKWPFVNVIATPPPDALQRFQVLTEFLLQLQLPYPSQILQHARVTIQCLHFVYVNSEEAC
jgi:hypothetical protein